MLDSKELWRWPKRTKSRKIAKEKAKEILKEQEKEDPFDSPLFLVQPKGSLVEDYKKEADCRRLFEEMCVMEGGHYEDCVKYADKYCEKIYEIKKDK